MKRSGKCPKCNSTQIVAGAIAVDHIDGINSHASQVAFEANPQAWLLRGRVSTPIAAWVCGECGYIEYYADDPRDLLDAAMEAERRMK